MDIDLLRILHADRRASRLAAATRHRARGRRRWPAPVALRQASTVTAAVLGLLSLAALG